MPYGHYKICCPDLKRLFALNPSSTDMVLWRLIVAANNVAVLTRLVELLARETRDLSVDLISSITTTAGGDVEMAVAVSRAAVVDLVA